MAPVYPSSPSCDHEVISTAAEGIAIRKVYLQ